MVGHQRLQLTHQLCVAAQLEIEVDPSLQCRKPHLFEPVDCRPGPPLAREVRQRRPAPLSQGLGQIVTSAAQKQMLEPFQVELPRLHSKYITGSP